MRHLALLIACGLSLPGCDAPVSENSPEYQKFLATQFKVRIMSGGSLRGTLVVVPPAPVSGQAEDFCELYVNGKKLGRFTLTASDDPLEFRNVPLRSGPNRVAVWNSATNRGAAETMDSRAGLHIEIAIGDDGVEMTSTPD